MKLIKTILMQSLKARNKFFLLFYLFYYLLIYL